MSSSQQQQQQPLRVGMLGAGTVGGGVYEILMGKSNRRRSTVTVTKICVQSLTKARDFTIFDKETTLTTNWRDLIADDIDCVVEVAGGCGVAKELILAALAQNKTVVTANKAVLFEYMKDIQTATILANSKARIGYEAAVCGGIPILNTLLTAYAGDMITSVQGICNGTTNFMLSHMQQTTGADDETPPVSYDAVLRQAQALGYAEADPTADVDGHDVRAKIAIVARLAFGTSPTLSDVLCTGIRSVTAMDFALCRDVLHSTIKLIGTAQAMTVDNGNHIARSSKNETGECGSIGPRSLCVTVHPTVVPLSHAFASVGGCGNAVSIQSHNIDTLTLTGPGAGRYPTAQSICADVYRAAAETLSTVAFPTPRPSFDALNDHNEEEGEKEWTIVTDYSSRFYVRVTVVTEQTTAAVIAAALGQALPVDQMLLDGHGDGTVALVTQSCLFSTVQAAVVGQTRNGETSLIMPLLSV